MNDSPNIPVTATDRTKFLDYLVVVAKHSQMIIYATMAVVILTFLVFFISPNQYTAIARLLPPQQNLTMSAQLMDIMGGGIKPGLSAGGGLLGGLFGLRTPADFYVAMIKSNTIGYRMIENFQLQKLYKKKYLEDTRKALSKQTKILIGKKDNIITIEVTDKSPERAADMANAYIKELDNLLQGLAIQEASSRLVFLEKELAAAEAKLVTAEEALRTFSEKNSVVQIDLQTRGMLQYVAQLRGEIDAKEVQVQVLRQQATQYNYDVVRLETQIKGLKEKLQAAESQLDKSCVGDVCLATSKMPMLGLEYIRLYRQVKYQETLNQLYTKMVEIARLDLVKDVAVVQVIDNAIPPEFKSNKRIIPAMAVGGVFFFLMVMVAFLMEYFQHVDEDGARFTKLTVLVNYLKPLMKWRSLLK